MLDGKLIGNGPKGTLGDGNLSYIFLSGSYTGVYDCHNSKESTVKIGTFNYI